MSIENIWGNINDEQDEDLSSLMQENQLSKLSSRSLFAKIKKNLLINMIWATIICMGYIIILFYFKIWQVQVGISIVFIFSLWVLYTAFIQYKKINIAVSPDDSLLTELKRHYHSINHWIQVQKQVALFIYPISAASGFMLGGVAGSGKTVEAFMSKPVVLVALLITIIILMPIAFYITKWLFRKSFGKHLDTLKKNIDALEQEKK